MITSKYVTINETSDSIFIISKCPKCCAICPSNIKNKSLSELRYKCPSCNINFKLSKNEIKKAYNAIIKYINN